MGMYTFLRRAKDADLPQLNDLFRASSLFTQESPDCLDLDKAGLPLNYLLTGSEDGRGHLLGFLMSGGREVGVDVGFGPARLFEADVVRDLSVALRDVDEDQFWGRFDPKLFEDWMGPDVWDAPTDELREIFLTRLHEVQRFVAMVADSGGRLLVAFV